METIWFALVALMIAIYVVLDGFDIGAGIVHGFEQNRMLEEFAILDHQLNACAVHMDDAASADVEMANFAVTHLAVGQSDRRAAGLNQCIGVVAQEPIIHRLAGKGDGIGVGCLGCGCDYG